MTDKAAKTRADLARENARYKRISAQVHKLRVLAHKTRARIVLNKRRLLKLEAYHPGAAAALKWAKAQVGTMEHPAGSNSGPKISDWIRAGGGVPGWSWCQYFADAVLVHGGGVQLQSGYTVAVVDWANAGTHGLRRVPVANEQPGDFVFYKWPGVSGDFCDHVGVSAGGGWRVEGNTSSGNAGSQNNGGGVFLRKRGNGNVVAVVRPTYGKA